MRNELVAVAFIALFVTAPQQQAEARRESVALDIRAMLPQERANYYTSKHSSTTTPGRSRGVARQSSSERGMVVGGRPPGCPVRYCGCGLSRKIFGKIIPELNLAWNWPKYFPRAAAAPDMVAARPGHVMGLISHVSGYDWLVYDANSGRGLTRIHVRSIRGYVIVDPHGSVVASRRITTSVYSARGHVQARNQ